MKKVVVYSKNNCPQCRMVKKLLTDKEVSFEERNIEEEPEYIEYLKSLEFKTVPVTDIDGELIPGFNPPALRKALGV